MAHLFARCPRFNVARQAITGLFQLQIPVQQWTVSQLLQFLQLPPIQDALYDRTPDYLLGSPVPLSESDPDPPTSGDSDGVVSDGGVWG